MFVEFIYKDGSVFSQKFDARPGLDIVNYPALKEVNINQYRYYPYDNEAKMIELHDEIKMLKRTINCLLDKVEKRI